MYVETTRIINIYDVQELIEIVVQEPLCLQKISQRGFKILTSPYRNGVFTNLISPIENSEEESESSQQFQENLDNSNPLPSEKVKNYSNESLSVQ